MERWKNNCGMLAPAAPLGSHGDEPGSRGLLVGSQFFEKSLQLAVIHQPRRPDMKTSTRRAALLGTGSIALATTPAAAGALQPDTKMMRRYNPSMEPDASAAHIAIDNTRGKHAIHLRAGSSDDQHDATECMVKLSVGKDGALWVEIMGKWRKVLTS